MKNLFDSGAAAKLAQRVERLQPGTQPLWGSMTATEMLFHCNKVNAHLLVPAQPLQKSTTLRQFLARWVVLYLMNGLPKGARAPKQMQVKGSIDASAFGEQQRLFTDIMQRMGRHTDPVLHRHPYFGNLSTRQWGLAAWKHVDHHLRQFGL